VLGVRARAAFGQQAVTSAAACPADDAASASAVGVQVVIGAAAACPAVGTIGADATVTDPGTTQPLAGD